MPISRKDLTGVGSPEALVKHILQSQPNLPVPVPIQELCSSLGILGIDDLDADGFEGSLVTDAKRSEGTILAKRGGEPRRRFTIAHELGHFLMAHHVPDQPGRFLCKSSDLRRLTAKESDQRQRREVEANRFATLMLMPPHLLQKAMAAFPGVDLLHVLALARDFAMAKETAARAYVQYHPGRIAIVVTGNGRVQRCYRSLAFPDIICAVGSPVPEHSLNHSTSHRPNTASDIAACAPNLWIDVKRDLCAPTLFEQVYVQPNGFAMILLRLEPVPEESARQSAGWTRVGATASIRGDGRQESCRIEFSRSLVPAHPARHERPSKSVFSGGAVVLAADQGACVPLRTDECSQRPTSGAG